MVKFLAYTALGPGDMNAISAGANVKAVQRMLGHSSAAMTLDTYADLFDDDLDRVGHALGDTRTRSTTMGESPPA